MAPTEKIERTFFALWYVNDFVCVHLSFLFCLLTQIHGSTSTIEEYHWIYRFVVQDASIRLMGESCGYLEQVDDRAVFGVFSGKDYGSKVRTRRQDKRRKSRRLKRHNSFKGLRRRQHPHKDESSYDSSVFQKEYSRKRSLLDGREDEERPDAASVNNKTSAYYNVDEQYTKEQLNTGAVIM